MDGTLDWSVGASKLASKSPPPSLPVPLTRCTPSRADAEPTDSDDEPLLRHPAKAATPGDAPEASPADSANLSVDGSSEEYADEQAGSSSDEDGSDYETLGSRLAAQQRKRKAEGEGGSSSSGGGERKRTRVTRFRRIRPEERCGKCVNCLNPHRKKPCETARRRQEEEAARGGAGPTTGGARAAAAPPPQSQARQVAAPAPADSFSAALAPIMGPSGAIAAPRHAETFVTLMARADSAAQRTALLQVLEASAGAATAAQLGAELVRRGALPRLEAWLRDAVAERRARTVSRALALLARLPVTFDALRACGLGRAVGQLRKDAAFGPDVHAAAAALVNKWKALVAEAGQQRDAATGAAPAAPAPKSAAAAAAAKPAAAAAPAVKPAAAVAAAKPAAPAAKPAAAAAAAKPAATAAAIRPIAAAAAAAARPATAAARPRPPERQPSGTLAFDDMFKAADAKRAAPPKEAPQVVRKVGESGPPVPASTSPPPLQLASCCAGPHSACPPCARCPSSLLPSPLLRSSKPKRLPSLRRRPQPTTLHLEELPAAAWPARAVARRAARWTPSWALAAAAAAA